MFYLWEIYYWKHVIIILCVMLFSSHEHVVLWWAFRIIGWLTSVPLSPQLVREFSVATIGSLIFYRHNWFFNFLEAIVLKQSCPNLLTICNSDHNLTTLCSCYCCLIVQNASGVRYKGHSCPLCSVNERKHCWKNLLMCTNTPPVLFISRHCSFGLNSLTIKNNSYIVMFLCFFSFIGQSQWADPYMAYLSVILIFQ